MEDKRVEALAADVLSHLESAKQRLWDEMKAYGLTPAGGWRIREELRHTMQGTQWIFRPVHLRETPPDIAVSVAIDHDGRPLVA